MEPYYGPVTWQEALVNGLVYCVFPLGWIGFVVYGLFKVGVLS